MTTGGMQHEMRMVLSALFCLLVEESVVNGGGKCNTKWEGVVKAVVFAGCSSSKASANKLFQWEIQHELWRV